LSLPYYASLRRSFDGYFGFCTNGYHKYSDAVRDIKALATHLLLNDRTTPRPQSILPAVEHRSPDLFTLGIQDLFQRVDAFNREHIINPELVTDISGPPEPVDCATFQQTGTATPFGDSVDDLNDRTPGGDVLSLAPSREFDDSFT
jgi:hypothetical protein